MATATEANKYYQSLNPKEKEDLDIWTKKKLDARKKGVSGVSGNYYGKLILEYKYEKEKLKEEKRKAEYLKNNPPKAITPPAKDVKQPSAQEKPPVRDIKPPTQSVKIDEVPPKLKVEKTIPVYYDKPAKDVPLRHLTGVENMSRFRFRANDTTEQTFSKINYVKAILKNKTVNQKGEILKYYEFRVSIEKRSNQEYFYGSKNIKNRMYRFYIGKVWQK